MHAGVRRRRLRLFLRYERRRMLWSLLNLAYVVLSCDTGLDRLAGNETNNQTDNPREPLSMFPTHLITEARVRCGSDIASKKRLLESLGELLAEASTTLSPEVVFDRLLERERLGSTGLGHGIALPHARVEEVTAPVGAFIQLRQAVDFDAIDDQPVDLAFALLVPEAADERHLQLLAGLAERFNEARLRKRLRQCKNSAQLIDLLAGWEPSAVD